MGFLASAVLPADAYLVVRKRNHLLESKEMKKSNWHPLAPLRLPHRRRRRRLRLHPPAPGLALLEPPVHRGRRARHRSERLLRRARPDRRRVDLQGPRGQEGIPDGPLDERCAASVRECGLRRAEGLLCVAKSEGEGRGGC